MKEIDLKKAAKLLPHGAISEISFDTRIMQATVSRILQGRNLTGTAKVQKQVITILRKLRKDIENILSGIGEDNNAPGATPVLN